MTEAAYQESSLLPITKFFDNFELSDLQVLIITFGFIFTVLSFAFNMKRQRRFEQAKTLRELTNIINSDRKMKQLFFEADYDNFQIGNKFIGKEDEKTLVRFLDMLNMIAYTIVNKSLTSADLKGTTLGHAFAQSLENPGIKGYLYWVAMNDTHDFISKIRGENRLFRCRKIEKMALIYINKNEESIIKDYEKDKCIQQSWLFLRLQAKNFSKEKYSIALSNSTRRWKRKNKISGIYNILTS
ncbi:hypothetical protein [Nitrosomonas marina]|uniref:Uncharacterized protein n=1 Tax=Nitrosomonas marina TaxID=917 RepID=A0A1H8FEK4_9PROT|nr:hypothetical protein [Nitrosomonas marina]SEN30102.1 hypothetical protein SAMN05216325_1132 [Nitrosomonas marina]